MASQKPPAVLTLSITESVTPPDSSSLSSEDGIDRKHGRDLAPPPVQALATREAPHMEAALGDAVLRFLGIRKGPKTDGYDLDAVRTNLKTDREGLWLTLT
jgi:hypothetical protein